MAVPPTFRRHPVSAPEEKLWRVIVRHVRDADGEGLVMATLVLSVAICIVLFALAGAAWIIIRAAYGDFG